MIRLMGIGAMAAAMLLAFCAPGAAAEKVPDAYSVIVTRFYDPNTPEEASTKRLIEMMRKDKSLKVHKWGALSLPGGGKAQLLMAIAGKTAPDIGESWFHILQNEIRQGFLYPLNEWIGEDKNGDGYIDDSEAKWAGWKEIPPLWRRVATVNGKVYAIPQANTYYMGVIFRTDMVRSAGLNPNRPPQTWDELFYWGQRLTYIPPEGSDEREVRGLTLPPYGFTWLPWVQSIGGSPIVQVRKSPETGREYTFSADSITFVVTENGKKVNLSNVAPVWRANFASPEAVEAAGFYHKCRWQRWLKDPQNNNEPVNLTPADVANGYVMVGKRKLEFGPNQVITGVLRATNSSQREIGATELMGRGEIAMNIWFVQNLNAEGRSGGINPDTLSWFPIPAGPGPNGKRTVQIQRHYVVSYENTRTKPQLERNQIWRVMTGIADKQTMDNQVQQMVLNGMARFCNPMDLRRLGYEEYLRDVPKAIQENYQGIQDGSIRTGTEPWMGFWVTMDSALKNEVLSLILSVNGENFDYKQALRDVELKANSGLMFATPRATLDKYRPWARVVVVAVALVVICFVVQIVRTHIRNARNKMGARNVYNPLLAWALVLPALVLILLWSYYPLLRGMVMAFQDYKISGTTKFVGLDNFITLAIDPSFWMSMLRTVYFVFLNLILTFLAPIFLAVLLTDVPRFKIFFRTLFFLPQMSSGLVIALLWKLMYEPTPKGFFNQLIALIDKIPGISIGQQSWLADPSIAMICCVVPTVWASMGMASLIYLAALHSIPSDLYEAAEIDGAGIIQKFFRVTVPVILPLIIINFVGAFIGTFQNMGNIFLLTFGGPGEATMVVSLKIWVEAYNNLRFSMATSMAWVLGSLLIGFTYFQIKFLGKIEYRRAQE